MQPYKRLAVVKYDDYFAARSAYDSPKVIFDNRFVKVYWYKPDSLPTPPSSNHKANVHPEPQKGEEHPYDKEEFERSTQAAQKKFEEKKKKEAERQALEKQGEELAQKQAEEKRKLLEKLAAKGAISSDISMTDATTNGSPAKNGGKVSAHTQALRDKVAELEAEARSLGLDSALSDYPPRGRGRGRGRGSYRGWEGFAAPFRGSPRGRGGFRGRVAASGYNLDLRTKSVAISGVVFDEKKAEGVREHLIVSLPSFPSPLGITEF
jgi:RNA-binding protein 26